MPLLPPNYLDCVAAIGTGTDPKKRKRIGTGFLYGISTNEENKQGNRLYTVF
jgi:hypothetical protein